MGEMRIYLAFTAFTSFQVYMIFNYIYISSPELLDYWRWIDPMTLHFSLPITTAQRDHAAATGCPGKPPRSRTAWVAHGSATVRCWRWYHFGASCAFHFGHGLHMMLTFSDLTNKFVTYEDPGCAKVGKENSFPKCPCFREIQVGEMSLYIQEEDIAWNDENDTCNFIDPWVNHVGTHGPRNMWNRILQDGNGWHFQFVFIGHKIPLWRSYVKPCPADCPT